MPPRYRAGSSRVVAGSPFLANVSTRDERRVPGTHPFDLPLLRGELSLSLTTPVTFFVGENGSGKSTLLEALAWAVGFGSQGGSRDHKFEQDGHALGRTLALGWRQRTASGFFLRAETFHNFATYLESTGSSFGRYGGESFHTKSHGEAFLALFEHRFENGLFILDEPEAALSPQRQLAFFASSTSSRRRAWPTSSSRRTRQVELYMNGCRALSEETNESRRAARRTGRLSVDQRERWNTECVAARRA